MNSTIILVIFAILCTTTFALENGEDQKDEKSKLGSFCNPIDGCSDLSLTCIKNRCECAPGFSKSKKDDNICKEERCSNDKDCNKLDPNRRCYKGSCSQCKSGLFLDTVANRCVTKLGSACNQTRDCWISGSIMDFDEEFSKDTISSDKDEMPICRSGRCICQSNYFPTADWSACKFRNCGSQDECNPFGDDPNRFCSRALRTCHCNMGYYEEPHKSVCLPYIPMQYSLMMPFWLAMIMFTICILIYISRRLARARTVVSEQSDSVSNLEPIPYALNRPPPSYDTVVKEELPSTESRPSETNSQPPNYNNTVNRQV